MSISGPPAPLVLTDPKEYKEGDKIKKYTIRHCIGAGSFGKVYKVEDTEGKVFALKELALKNGEIPNMLMREVSLLSDTKHQNIIGLEKVFVLHDSLWLVMEFVEDTLKERMKQDYDKTDIAKWLKQMIGGVSYMHGNDIIHRDINPENLLVDSKDNLKIADFGLAKHIYHDQPMTPDVGNAQYSAPEVLLGSVDYDKAADMWSVGCVLAELVKGTAAFEFVGSQLNNMFDTDPHSSNRSADWWTCSTLDAIFRELGTPTEENWPGITEYPRYPKNLANHCLKLKVYEMSEDVGEQLRDMIQRLLQVIPSKRLTAAAAMTHPYYMSAN